MDVSRILTPEELGEALLAGLSAGSVEAIEPLLSEDVCFQHHPLPAARGKAAVLKVSSQIARHTRWSLVERHSSVADANHFLCERTECIQVMGLAMYLRGVMVLECRDGRIARITDYMDLIHCTGAFFRALIRVPLRWLRRAVQ